MESNYPYTGVQGACNATAEHTAVKVKTWNYVTLYESAQIKAALATGPVGIPLNSSSYYVQHYTGGVFNPTTTQCPNSWNDIDHTTLLVGYGTDATDGEYFIMKNSWGTSWGDEGYMLIAAQDNSAGACGMYLSPVIPTVVTESDNGAMDLLLQKMTFTVAAAFALVYSF